MATTQRVAIATGSTWTVVGSDLRVVEPVEQYLEFARASEFSHNTIKAYARGLALWWTFVERSGRPWTAIGLADFGRFIQDLRHGRIEAPPVDLGPAEAVGDATVALRVRAVMSFYRYQAASGGPAVAHLYETIRTSPGSYMPFMEHIARRDGRVRSKVRVRVPRTEVPVLSPAQVDTLIDSEASWNSATQSWDGDLRYRLLWSLLAETGMRLSEALAVQHRDWQAGRGSAATVSIVRRDHPHGLVPKSGGRRVHIGARLDQLYADHVWWLCDRGADALIDDWDNAYIFCNTVREPLYGPLRPESVYDHLDMRKRRLPALPAAMTPHWFRHTHATALLLAGVQLHVVSRRLGHRDVQTTINTYGHVTDDAELAALANWREVVKGWETNDDER